MRVNRYVLAVLAVWSLAATSCWYQRPGLEDMYADVEVGMSQAEVVELLGDPTAILSSSAQADPDDPASDRPVSEMFYIYDDPLEPVRFRFVLDDKAFVVEKYYETKEELAKRAEETKGQVPPVERLPGEAEPGRRYPGGALKRFETIPGMPEKIK